MRWSVYSIEGGTFRPLGYVNAPDSGKALLSAFDKWPGDVSPGTLQNGFVARPYTQDSMSLGKLFLPHIPAAPRA